MKKIFCVLLTTAMLFGVVIWSQIFVENTLFETSNKISEIVKQIASQQNINEKSTVEMIENLDDFWTKKEHILCLSINHNDLNRIGEQIKRVKVLAEKNEKENCQCELSVLAFYAESYIHVMDIKFENLL